MYINALLTGCLATVNKCIIERFVSDKTNFVASLI